MATTKTFDQHLAETGQQSKLDDLRRTGQYDAARSQYESGGVSGSPSNFADTVRQAQELQRSVNAPAVESLRSSLPEISKTYETQRQQTTAQIDPLKQRYQSLLDEVKGKAQASVNSQTKITSNELGKRGIVGSSTLAQQEIQNAVEPIRAGERTAITDIGLSQEQGLMSLQNILANLANAETEQKRGVLNSIGQLEAGAGQNAVQLALQQIQSQQQAAAQEQALKQAQQESALAERLYSQVTLPQSQASIANIQSEIAKRGQQSSGMDIQSFLGLFGGGGVSSGSPSIGSNVIELLKNGNVAQALELAYNP